MPNKDKHQFTVRIIPSGDKKSLEELLYSMADLLLDIVVKAKRADNVNLPKDTIEKGKPSL